MVTVVNINEKHLKLQFLYLVFRHGERAPLDFLPDYPQRNLWPDGAGSLTNKGKMEAFNIGKLLRQRYDKFLGEKYISENLYVRSTDVDRTLMSAQCCLAGMFPPTEEETFIKNIQWQPIPIHTKPLAEDQFRSKKPLKLQIPPGGVYNNPMHKRLYETFQKNQDLLEMSNTIGKCNNAFFRQLITMDCIFKMHERNFVIPEEYRNRIQDLSDMCDIAVLFLSIYNTEMNEGAVNLLSEIVEEIQNLIATEESSTKTKIYSLSDVHIIALVYALTNETMLCPYASCLMLEFYRSTEIPSQHYLKVLFLNDHDKDPLEMKVFQQKNEVCSFENFKQVAENYINIDKRTT